MASRVSRSIPPPPTSPPPSLPDPRELTTYERTRSVSPSPTPFIISHDTFIRPANNVKADTGAASVRLQTTLRKTEDPNQPTNGVQGVEKKLKENKLVKSDKGEVKPRLQVNKHFEKPLISIEPATPPLLEQGDAKQSREFSSKSQNVHNEVVCDENAITSGNNSGQNNECPKEDFKNSKLIQRRASKKECVPDTIHHQP